MNLLQTLGESLGATLRDVLPIALIIGFFQGWVLRRKVPNLARVLVGFGCVILGLATFLVGLEIGLFPLGETMARQLASPDFVRGRPKVGFERPPPHLAETPSAELTESTGKVNSTGEPGQDGEGTLVAPWWSYYWTYIFAFCIGFSATIAEPALIAVAMKAHQVSGGAIHVWGLRLAVAVGSGTGVALGTLRIVLGLPLPYFILAGYVVVMIQTNFAPRRIIPLAFDSGGVTTSTVTVPLVAALGLGLAEQIPGRDPVIDGFGLIAFAVLFPMITVMGYTQLAQWWNTRRTANSTDHSDTSLVAESQ